MCDPPDRTYKTQLTRHDNVSQGPAGTSGKEGAAAGKRSSDLHRRPVGAIFFADYRTDLVAPLVDILSGNFMETDFEKETSVADT